MFRHKLVQKLWELIEEEVKPRASSNPIITAIYFGMKHELPNILRSLDENPEAVESIRNKLKAVFEEDSEVTGVTEVPAKVHSIPEEAILDE